MMKYDYELMSTENGCKIEVNLDYVDMNKLSRAEVIGLYLINDISEKKVHELINISEEELEKLAEIILKVE